MQEEALPVHFISGPQKLIIAIEGYHQNVSNIIINQLRENFKKKS